MKKGQAGVTLVELLLAIVVVTISGIGLMGAYQWSLHLAEVAQQANMATNDLRDMMERIKTTAFTQLNTNFPNGTVNGPAVNLYTAVVGGFTLSTEQITVTHSPNTAADPRELIVLLTWTNRGRQYQRQLSTMRSSQAT
jgi:type II secretory pathway pseudopilin PulG